MEHGVGQDGTCGSWDGVGLNLSGEWLGTLIFSGLCKMYRYI